MEKLPARPSDFHLGESDRVFRRRSERGIDAEDGQADTSAARRGNQGGNGSERLVGSEGGSGRTATPAQLRLSETISHGSHQPLESPTKTELFLNAAPIICVASIVYFHCVISSWLVCTRCISCRISAALPSSIPIYPGKR